MAGRGNTILFSYPTVSSFWGLTVGKNRINNILFFFLSFISLFLQHGLDHESWRWRKEMKEKDNIPMAYQDSVAIGIITNHIIFNLVFGRIYNLMLEDERRYDL